MTELDATTRLLLGLAFLFAGLLLIRLRGRIVPWLRERYRRLGIEVPEATYARQFVFIGILMIVFGFLITLDLLFLFD